MLRPIPFTGDPDTAGLFAAAARGTLAVCECRRCDRAIHLPRAICNVCHGPTTWRDVGNTGRLTTYTVVEQQVHPAFLTPYTVVLVELDDAPGVRLLGRLDGAHDLPLGSPMIATFDEFDGGYLPNWQRRGDT